MRLTSRKLMPLALGLSLFGAATMGRQLGAREARQRIAETMGLDKPDKIHIKSVTGGLGGDWIVEASFDGAFHLTSDKSGNWTVAEVRLGDRRWESIELIKSAVQKEKILRTTADLRTLATALESFRRERGFYVAADSGRALIDNLAPRYLKAVLRLDAWSREFDYRGAATSYRLASLGPDGKPGTSDDIVIENGNLVQGAVQ